MNDKISKLMQLNSFMDRYVKTLERLENTNLEEVIKEEVAQRPEVIRIEREIREKVIAENKKFIEKTKLKLEAIEDMIGEVETEDDSINNDDFTKF